MTEYKHPYIPTRYYGATLFACKMVGEGRTIDDAVQIAAEHAGVGPVKLKGHVQEYLKSLRQEAYRKKKEHPSNETVVTSSASEDRQWWVITVYVVDSRGHKGFDYAAVVASKDEQAAKGFLKDEINDVVFPKFNRSFDEAFGPFANKETAQDAARKLTQEIR